MAILQEKVQYWFLNDAWKPEVIVYRICEGTDGLKTALRSDMTSLQVMVASARCMVCRRIETVTLLCLVTWPSTPTYRVKSEGSKRYDSHCLPVSSLTFIWRSLYSVLAFTLLSFPLNRCACLTISVLYLVNRAWWNNEIIWIFANKSEIFRFKNIK